ncbi:hypothetical protein GCM10010255_01520 [Streptomyces coeruleofuscus]|uniref:Secreted protein n=1 Tax=Streptomyces coeruleofuscus TaxID=66879 RepID=A0ABN3HH82_9ACTN
MPGGGETSATAPVPPAPVAISSVCFIALPSLCDGAAARGPTAADSVSVGVRNEDAGAPSHEGFSVRSSR